MKILIIGQDADYPRAPGQVEGARAVAVSSPARNVVFFDQVITSKTVYRPALSRRAHVASAIVGWHVRGAARCDAAATRAPRPERTSGADLARGARVGMAARGLLYMDSVGRRAAARNGLAAMTVVLLVLAAPAFADGAPNLILQLVTAGALDSAATNVSPQVATLDPGRPPLLSPIPKQVHLLDGYQYDFEDSAGLKKPRDMVDVDRIVSYDILSRPPRGWMGYVAYDAKYRGPVTGGRSDILRIHGRVPVRVRGLRRAATRSTEPAEVRWVGEAALEPLGYELHRAEEGGCGRPGRGRSNCQNRR